MQVFELVKNSLRAVHDRFDESDHEAPPIRIVVAEGEEDITIKVRAGGRDFGAVLNHSPQCAHTAAAQRSSSCSRAYPDTAAPLAQLPKLCCSPLRQVSDEGGGIPRSGLPKMWTYLYTTAK